MLNTRCPYCKNFHELAVCTSYQYGLKNKSLSAIKLKNKIESGGGRVCATCASVEHTSNKCPKKFDDKKKALTNQKAKADNAFAWLHEIGFGPGCMLSGMSNERSYGTRGKEERIVVVEEFGGYSAKNFFEELLYGDQRNWFPVNAIDTSAEKIRKIYLPYHPFYSPKPTSKKVQVVHKANKEDIENLKKFISAYSNPIMNYDSAEKFFAAGFKFKSGKHNYNIESA